MPETVEFRSLRADWYANGNFMARALQRQLRSRKPLLTFKEFPRHWLPLFEWAGAPWTGSIEPDSYVPLFSGRTEAEIVDEIARARARGQLRLLTEVAASTEIVLCETLQRIDGRLAPVPTRESQGGQVRLTTWHSYNRPDVRAFDAVLAGFRQTKPGVLFIPCAKARPYHHSQSQRRLLNTARAAGLDMDRLDTIVITSIGPVPEAYWEHDFVRRYDTGVRDIYRLMLQLKSLLKQTSYVEAWDLMPLAPYSDIIRLLHLDGLLPEPRRLDSVRRRNLPIYRPSKSSPLEPDIRCVLATIKKQGQTIWLGQSVDTSTIHDGYEDFAELPILTSVGCAIRRPRAVSEKFDGNLRSRLGAKSSLMVDSGGFVLMTKQDSRWDVGRVGRLYDRVDADHLVSLDVPPSAGDSRADRLRKYDKTFRNLEKLFHQFGNRVVPVVHGVTATEIERNCHQIKRLYPSPAIIGIGGLVPTLQKCGAVRKAGPATPQRRIAEAVRCVHAHFPRSRIHLFGVGSLHTVLGVVAFGARSVDSIGWRQAAGFGSIYIPGRHRRLLTLREREHPCRPFATDEDLDLLARCRCPVCRTAKRHANRIELLAGHYKPRAVHNIWVLYSEIADYLRARQAGTDAAFLSSRLSEAWMEAVSTYRISGMAQLAR